MIKKNCLRYMKQYICKSVFGWNKKVISITSFWNLRYTVRNTISLVSEQYTNKKKTYKIVYQPFFVAVLPYNTDKGLIWSAKGGESFRWLLVVGFQWRERQSWGRPNEQFLENYNDVKIDFSNKNPSQHLVLWCARITRWWMFTLQHRQTSNLIC